MLATAVDVQRWLAADAETPYEERLSRDRGIGMEIDAADSGQAAHRIVLDWWVLVEREANNTGDGARFVLC